MVRDILISILQRSYEAHKIRNIKITGSYEAVLSQDVRQ